MMFLVDRAMAWSLISLLVIAAPQDHYGALNLALVCAWIMLLIRLVELGFTCEAISKLKSPDKRRRRSAQEYLSRAPVHRGWPWRALVNLEAGLQVILLAWAGLVVTAVAFAVVSYLTSMTVLEGRKRLAEAFEREVAEYLERTIAEMEQMENKA